MSGPFELIIFDCDGVLVDSERIAVDVDKVVLAELGWDLSESEIIERFVGRSPPYVRGQVEAHLGRSIADEWKLVFLPRYYEAIETRLRPVDGIVEALDQVTAPVCVASGSTHDRIRRSLELTGLLDRFEGRIFSTSEVANGKPAPDVFLHAAAQLGIAPGACAVVEDSRYGVEAGRAARMRVFAYAGGLSPVSWLEGPGTIVFDDMRQLPRLLGEV